MGVQVSPGPFCLDEEEIVWYFEKKKGGEMRRLLIYLLVVLLFTTSCSVVIQRGRRSDIERIRLLEERLKELEHAKLILEERLAQEIKEKKLRLSMENKRIVVTFDAEFLIDPGKAQLKKESLYILDKVAKVLKKDIPSSYRISIEGHTDNQPIKYSGWKSNWELSCHRALSVLHYLEKKGVNPSRLSATGFGEYHPVASNETEEGRALNRRVEIVIIPATIRKVKKERFIAPEREIERPEEEVLK